MGAAISSQGKLASSGATGRRAAARRGRTSCVEVSTLARTFTPSSTSSRPPLGLSFSAEMPFLRPASMSMSMQTAHTNGRAQAVYDRVGATRDDRWLDYSLAVPPGATTPDS